MLPVAAVTLLPFLVYVARPTLGAALPAVALAGAVAEYVPVHLVVAAAGAVGTAVAGVVVRGVVRSRADRCPDRRIRGAGGR
ncbi:hypothetical protein CTZ27_17705 [Streptomyces griseocarneus]|nr:hypothetical protein CTZ27_17705 [Streptomyces griseocarneus]